ncbi:FAD binding domain-containing protein [Pseudonocardia zijingensis]|jgi:CO/xanthine dehydrogenase FAD-binding subunit|uniref:FAD binding domain-containing protein n=1 Tax=Pseudonocardia zijingensis TaxID=153376 RepID=A0ABN1P1G2_9PSEU
MTAAVDHPAPHYLKPTSLADALALRSERPSATVVAGGTDLMVAVNEGRRDLDEVIDVSEVAELGGWDRDGDRLRIGAALPLTRVVDELAVHLPGLAGAARLVGSPPIRHRATLGGNIATASPAGDTLPPMLAAGATVELASVRGVREVRSDEFFLGPGRTVVAPDELIVAVRMTPAAGEAFAKTGTRQAMVISVAAAAVRIDPDRRHVGIALGSVAPTPLRARTAEDFATRELDWTARTAPDAAWWAELGRLAAGDAAPIDDLRGTAEHRRRVAGVLVARCARQAWSSTC